MMVMGIFCGSSAGSDTAFIDAARVTGKTLAQAGIAIVYGGGRVGLMGAVADAALAQGGKVIGVMPRLLADQELSHPGLTTLHVVENMHERKAKMAQITDSFIAMPGGPGTLEEIFEQWTWAQLGIHDKPCAFLNVNGYFDPLKTMNETMVSQGFMKQTYADMLTFSDSIEDILRVFATYTPPPHKWTPAFRQVG
ncbi:TIGR00730 family Rossman fold protein [Symbiopectobacterium purcellii]|uniref:LOG family protein n=1 Tax=Symbiopectobacterium purcellii TaxID=2871826 RepID=UPI003F87CED5